MEMAKGDQPKVSRKDRRRMETLVQTARQESDAANPAGVREAVNELNEIRESYGLVKRS
jgi:hypothetical protein